MTVVSRCDPPMPLNTPRGSGLAHWRIERGIEAATTYEVWITDGRHAGEIWEFDQRAVRAQANITAGRTGVQAVSQPSRAVDRPDHKIGDGTGMAGVTLRAGTDMREHWEAAAVGKLDGGALAAMLTSGNGTKP